MAEPALTIAEILHAVVPGMRVFASCDAYRPDPADALPSQAAFAGAGSLLREISCEYATPSYDGRYFKRSWHEPYLLALVSDIADRVSPHCSTTVRLGASRYTGTSCFASSSEAHMFFNLREITLVGVLAQRLRRMVEVTYESPKSVQIGLLDPAQPLIQARGLVAQIVQASMLDALDGRSATEGALLSSVARLADRIGEGVASLHWLAELSNDGRAPEESLPSWNPIAPAFVIGHEFGHLLVGGNTRFEAFRAGEMGILHVFDYWRRARVHIGQLAADVIASLENYDRVNAERCQRGLDLIPDRRMMKEPLADIIGLMCATDVIGDDAGLKILASRGPEPAADLLLWQGTAVAASLTQAAKIIGVEIAHGIPPELRARFAEALANYLLRASTSTLCMSIYTSDEVAAGETWLTGKE